MVDNENFDLPPIESWRKEIKGAADDFKDIKDYSEILGENLKKQTGSEKVRNENLKKLLDSTIKAAKAGKINLDQLNKRVGLIKQIENGELTLEQTKSKQRDFDDEIISIQRRYTGINKKKGEALIREVQKNKKLLETEQHRLETQEMVNAGMDTLDGVTGGIVGKAKGVLETFKKLGPTVGAVVVGLMAAAALLTEFEKTSEEMAGTFGAFGTQAKFLRTELVHAHHEFIKFGKTGHEALQAIDGLSNEFGVSVQESAKLSKNVLDVSIVTATTVENTAKLIGLFTETQGLTGQQAENLLISTTALANANDVAPNKVLEDVAGNTEQFALFAKDGGENILRAAVQARKLGVSLDKVATIANGLLNFQDSLNKEIEASVMLGRDLNLQKARELALNNDIEGATTEIVKQLGSEAEFNKLNALERQALADAVGLQTADVQKLVNKEKESVTLAGELAKQNIGKLIPEKTITMTARLVGQLTALGVSLSETFGPILSAILVPLNLLFTGLSGVLYVIDMLVGTGPALVAVLVALKGQAIATAAVNMKAMVTTAATTVANFFKAASLNSILTAGLSTPMMVAGAITAAGMMYKGIRAAMNVGDLKMENGRPIAMSKTPGGLDIFQGAKNDDLLMAPGLASATGGGGTSVNIDTKGIEKSNRAVLESTENLRADMKSYFGFGGSANKAIGDAAGNKMITTLQTA